LADSATVIAALKFEGGIVIGADSQASDLVALVRWPVEKLCCVGNQPLVLGFSGSVGMAQRARAQLESTVLHTNVFGKRHSIQGAMDKSFTPVYKKIKDTIHPPQNIYQSCLWGLSAFWAEGAPQILEHEINGDSSFHDFFHAIGSASNTAYAIYRTLGGKELCALKERWSIPVILRILRTCVNVELWGVSEPLSLWVVSPGKAREVSEDEIQVHLQSVEKWERDERLSFFSKAKAP
jgi:20S proteasome alpha/beta subunit